MRRVYWFSYIDYFFSDFYDMKKSCPYGTDQIDNSEQLVAS